MVLDYKFPPRQRYRVRVTARSSKRYAPGHLQPNSGRVLKWRWVWLRMPRKGLGLGFVAQEHEHEHEQVTGGA
jgi:hypothetical protein